MQQGTPEEWIFYDVSGQGEGSSLSDVHVDADGLYWVQRVGRLHRGSLDGTATPTEFAKFDRAPSGAGIRSDSTHVYFLDGPILRRWPKAGGVVEDIRLLWEHPGGPGPLFVDDQYVYVAMHGCAAITRYDKQLLEPVEIYITLPSEGPGNGPTTIEADGQEVYCASWGNVFKVPWWEEASTRLDGNDPALRVATSEQRIWAMVLTEGHAYWGTYASVGDKFSFGRVARGGGLQETIQPPAGVFVHSVSSRLVYDSHGRRIFFSAGAYPLESTWMNPGSFIAALSIDTLAFSFFAREIPTGYFAIDDRYLYWPSSQVGAIRRMPLDAKPLFVIEP